MNRLILTAIALLSTATSGTTGQSFHLNSYDLQSECRAYARMQKSNDPTEGVGTGLCYGTIAGVLEVIAIENLQKSSLGSQDLGVFCLPDDLKVSDAIQKVSLWMDKYPGQLKTPAYYAIRYALEDAYPCRK